MNEVMVGVRGFLESSDRVTSPSFFSTSRKRLFFTSKSINVTNTHANMLTLTGATKTVLYSAWFCPFAQRVWCALNELGVEYERVEALNIDPDTEAYVKHSGLLAHNPQGLVPTVVQTDKNDIETSVCDSLEILRQLFDAQGLAPSTLEALSRDAKHYNEQLCSPFYTVLMKQNENERKAGWEQMLRGYWEFADHLVWRGNGEISFYQPIVGENQSTTTTSGPGLVDFCVYPFIHRLYIIEHYLGLVLPAEEEPTRKLMAWRARMEALPSVQATLAAPEKLIPIYLRYADGTAKSKVGDFVRQGRHAHEV